MQVKPFDYEHSEMLLYQNMVMMDAGMYQEALDHLDTYDKQILDRLSIQEARGKSSGFSVKEKYENRYKVFQ